MPRPPSLDGRAVQAGASGLALSEALLDFAAAPGRHALRLREPMAVFDALDVVALWALGRVPADLPEPQAVRQAALLFVLRACFAPGLNHYQLLGLPPDFDAALLRSRYRALIRLTHPDMGIEGLPPEAAGMVNRAHAVLSDAAQRALYDRQLLAQLPTAAAMPRSAQACERASSGAGGWALVAHDRPWVGWLQRLHPQWARMALMGGVLLAGCVLALGWVMRSSGQDTRLVATERSLSTLDVGAASDGAVRLRIPAQWSNGIGVPRSDAPLPLPEVAAANEAKAANGGALAAAQVVAAVTAVTPKPALAPSPRAMPAAEPATAPALASSSSPSFLSAFSAVFASAPAPAPSPSPSPAQAPAPAPAPAPVPAPVKVEASEPSPAPVKVAASEPSPAPVKAAAPVTVWDVDLPSARTYLQDLLNQLAQPEQARTTSFHLRQMNVEGSLLLLPWPAPEAARALTIERADLNESHRAGVLRIRGVLKGHLDTPDSPPRPVRFRVQAEFKGTPQGTVLTLLDLRDAN